MSIALVQMLTEAQVRTALRHDALNVTLAILFVAVGLAAVSVLRLRRHARSPELLWFGLFLDLGARHFRYGAAGHPPLLWLRQQDGLVDAVAENGMVLGLFADAPYTHVERPLDGASRFVLYTDGLTEARNDAGEEFGDEQLQSALSAGAALDANRIAASLLDNLGRWAGYGNGRPQEDDITLIVVDV